MMGTMDDKSSFSCELFENAREWIVSRVEHPQAAVAATASSTTSAAAVDNNSHDR